MWNLTHDPLQWIFIGLSLCYSVNKVLTSIPFHMCSHVWAWTNISISVLSQSYVLYRKHDHVCVACYVNTYPKEVRTHEYPYRSNRIRRKQHAFGPYIDSMRGGPENPLDFFHLNNWMREKNIMPCGGRLSAVVLYSVIDTYVHVQCRCRRYYTGKSLGLFW